jgi:hypothetical protein
MLYMAPGVFTVERLVVLILGLVKALVVLARHGCS